jgi:2-polyprenyl-6-hydroxyphenyl methylase / 3-demethylubiquinone-9 3-methyltransferase
VGASDGTVDLAEISRFAAQAGAWWNPKGGFSALHRINPIRLDFIRARLVRHFHRSPDLLSPFAGLRLLDIGCGGGLVAEPMSRLGFAVTGVDAEAAAIAVAREHTQTSDLAIDYRVATAESIADGGERFDVVLALEVLEHVADRDAFWRSLGALVASGGAAIVTTLNRTARSFALGIIGAEFILNWLPRGTHDWRKFVRPSEIILSLRRNSLRPIEIVGLGYDLGADKWLLTRDIDVNYIVFATRNGY